MKKSNLGISLISLIITVIVIIILAAIVIFTGLGTPDQANFAKFTSEFSDFNLAIKNDYMNRYTNYAINGQTRSKAQIYYEIASGTNIEMNDSTYPVGTVSTLGLDIMPEALEGDEYYLITSDANIKGWKGQKQFFSATEKHYVTDEGEAFFLPGYLVEENGVDKWYVNERKYYVGEGKIADAEIPLPPNSLGANVKVGDYVEYIPTEVTYLTNQSEDVETGFSQETLTTDTSVKWRVWDIQGDKVRIVPEIAVNSITLYGSTGYLNAENVLDDACKKLYASSLLGVSGDSVESMRIEDVEAKAGYDKRTFSFSAGDFTYTYGMTQEYTYPENTGGFYTYEEDGQTITSKLPRILGNDEPEQVVNLRKNLTDSKVLVASLSDRLLAVARPEEKVSSVKVKGTAYFFEGEDIKWKELSNESFEGKNYGELMAGESWLASPCVSVFPENAEFGVHYAASDGVGAYFLYDSYGGEDDPAFALRPIVTLSSTLPTYGGDGKTNETAWELTQVQPK